LIGGKSLEESFVSAAYGMIDYMTDRSCITIDPSQSIEFTAIGIQI
jgi:SHS2 domain-containing protein